jgi:hypothetical protein
MSALPAVPPGLSRSIAPPPRNRAGRWGSCAPARGDTRRKAAADPARGRFPRRERRRYRHPPMSIRRRGNKRRPGLRGGNGGVEQPYRDLRAIGSRSVIDLIDRRGGHRGGRLRGRAAVPHAGPCPHPCCGAAVCPIRSSVRQRLRHRAGEGGWGRNAHAAIYVSTSACRQTHDTRA